VLASTQYSSAFATHLWHCHYPQIQVCVHIKQLVNIPGSSLILVRKMLLLCWIHCLDVEGEPAFLTTFRLEVVQTGMDTPLR